MNLITGATGLVGAHVAYALIQQGKPVVAIKRTHSDIQKTKHLFSYYNFDGHLLFNQIKWIDADVTDIYSLLEAFNGIDTVYHCAGFISFNSRDREQMLKVNAQGTANVVNAALEKNIKHLVHVSSIATLQNPDIKLNIDESVYWKYSPEAGAYAISKYNGEREVWRGMEEGLNISIVNPGVIVGPGFWKQGSGQLFTKLDKGLSFYTDGSTGYIDVRDVAEIMIRLSDEKIFGKRFVLTENNYSFKEFLNLVALAMGKKAPGIRAGKILLNTGKWFETIFAAFSKRERILTKETIQAAININTFNNTLIKNTLNYTFIPIKDSVDFSVKCFLKDQKLTIDLKWS